MRTDAGHALFPELTYANDGHSRLQRLIIEAIETLAGRNRLESRWRREMMPRGDDRHAAYPRGRSR